MRNNYAVDQLSTPQQPRDRPSVLHDALRRHAAASSSGRRVPRRRDTASHHNTERLNELDTLGFGVKEFCGHRPCSCAGCLSPPGDRPVPDCRPSEVHADMVNRKFTRDEIATRNHKHDAVIIIDNVVYDVTKFLEDHPGGSEVLLQNAGKDASQCFHNVGHSEDAIEWRKSFRIGEVVDEDKWEVKKREDVWIDSNENVTLSGLISVCGAPVTLALLAVLFYIYLF